MREKTTRELNAMLDDPDDWLPEALAAAREELRERGYDAGGVVARQAGGRAVASDTSDVCERPTGLNVACVIGFTLACGWMLLGLYVKAHPRPNVPQWISAALLLGGIYEFACMAGLWRMHRAAYGALLLYVCLAIAAVSLIGTRLLAFVLVRLVLPLAVGAVYYKDMR